MIKKVYRLNERQTKKVLSVWKPFFSYWVTSKILKNNLNYNRFSIVIWSKSVENNVSRVFFRRNFFHLTSDFIASVDKWVDIVFFVKKQLKLDKNDKEVINSFKKDIKFLLYKNNLEKWKIKS